MKVVLLFILILLSQAVSEAQKISEGLYVNAETEEFVEIQNDSIYFRLCNRDAFGTFTIGMGHYKYKGNGKYYIQQQESFKGQTSIIKQNPRIDSLISIRTQYNDCSPIISSYVYFKELDNPRGKADIVCVSDLCGLIILSENQIQRLNNKELLLQVEALGFSTEKMVVLKRGFEYVIHSTISKEYPFRVFKTGNVYINECNPNDIEVNISKYHKKSKISNATKLSKVDTCSGSVNVIRSFEQRTYNH